MDTEKYKKELETAIYEGVDKKLYIGGKVVEKVLKEAVDEALRIHAVSGSFSPDDFWEQEYAEAVKEIGNLQDQLKDAESVIRDMESELRSRY